MSNVVVVGAGLAGLAAARRLVASGHEVTVIEARERAGGRTEGLVLDDGTPLELGGAWLGEGHSRMYQLVGELGLSTFRTWNDEGSLLLDLGGKRSLVKPHKGAAPRISPFAVADLAQGLLRFGRLAARTDLERPWLTPNAEVLDGQTWERRLYGGRSPERRSHRGGGRRALTADASAHRCGPKSPASRRVVRGLT
ncbi:MAG TPA: FAD-dependent oxidoreductase [Streptosporangiaceae bacterium]|nr:FAD-dependent oxidoreductase [Streptosporangiaceae bacterium]